VEQQGQFMTSVDPYIRRAALKVLRRSETQDCLFLAVVFVLSLSNYIIGLGFYDDDWALLASMSFSQDQSLVGVFAAVTHDQDNEIRPLQFFTLALLYKIFGFSPRGYHLINGLFLFAGFTLLYFVTRALRQPRVLALAISILYMLLPNYSTDRFWIASSTANVSMCLALLGIYSHLQALCGPRNGFWRWEALAILCVIGSGLAYEVFLPLVLLATALLFTSELATDWPRSRSERAIGKAALHQAGIVVAVAIVIVVKGLWAPRVPQDLEVTSYVFWTGRAILKAFFVSYGYHLLFLPSTVWHVIRHYADASVVVTAVAIGMLAFVRLYTLPDRCARSPGPSREKMLMYLGCGIALFVAGYSLFPLNPAENGINNRTAIAGTLGVAVSVVGLLGLLTSFASVGWRKALFGGAIALIGMSGALIIDALAKFWIESYRLQTAILLDIYNHIKFIPSGGTLILDGVCPYEGPAPVFESTWDLSAALSLLYGHADIRANIVTRWLTVGENGLVVPTIKEPAIYPFDRLYVYHFGRKETYALTDSQTAESYFDNISTDRATRCPADVYGNGVDVLNGLISRFSRRAVTAGGAPAL
jgi:hypothetical protein